jgi:hypothetical protein
MIETGLTIAGLKMAWNGVKWVLRINKAPWSAADVDVTLRDFDHGGWNLCFVRFVNDKQFVLEINKFRVTKPSGALIRNVDNELGQQMLVGSEEKEKRPNWRVGARTDRASEITRTVFIKLPGKRPISVVLEFDMVLANNQRNSFTVLARSSPIG